MNERECKRTMLMDGAVKCVAQLGFEQASTRNIATYAKVSDTYIYRLFANREDLLMQAFLREDKRLCEEMICHYPIMEQEGTTLKERSYRFWQCGWNYLMEHPDECLFYARYYMSPSFKENVYQKHVQMYMPLAEQMKHVFSRDINVTELTHYALDYLINVTSKVLLYEIPKDEQLCRKNFQLLFGAIQYYIQEHLFETESAR